jgi:hypothetical protein
MEAREKKEQKRPKSWDEYEIKARYLPCLISVVPISHFFVNQLGNKFFFSLIQDSNWLLYLSHISIPLVLGLCLVQVQVTLSKIFIEDRIFGTNGLHFPTTDMLLLSGGKISMEKKALLRDKLSKSFGFNFPTADAETKDMENSRLLARDAVSMIRKEVGKGVMTHQYNIRYGFFRNLIGGVLWAIPGSIGCITIYAKSKNWPAMVFFALIACGYLSLYLFRKTLLTSIANSYASSLTNDYLSLE